MCFVASCNAGGSVVSLRFEPLSSARALAAAATAAAGPEEPARASTVTWWDSADADHLRDIPALVSITEKREAAHGAAPVVGAAAVGSDTSFDAACNVGEDAAYGVATNRVGTQPPLPEYYYDGNGGSMDGMATGSAAWTASTAVPTGMYPQVPPPVGAEATVKPEPLSPVSVEGGAMIDDPSLLCFLDGQLPDRLPSPPPIPSDATFSMHTDGASRSGAVEGNGGASGRGGGCSDGGVEGDSCGPLVADPDVVPTFDTFYSMIPEECLPVDNMEMVHEQRLGCVYRVLERVGGETIDGRRRRGRKRVHPKPPSRMLADLASIDSCTHILDGVASEATARQAEMRVEMARLLATRDSLLSSKAAAAAAASAAAGRSVTVDDWGEVLNALAAWNAEPEEQAMEPAFC